MKLSIVVPIYNVAPWLERCLESLVKINLPVDDYEIVAVNDGSTDDSLQILSEFSQKQKDVSIVIISQANRGLSAARNIGLSVAKGNYIWFVDSDDFIEWEKVKMLIETSESQHLDILCFGLQLVYDNRKKIPYLIKDKSNGAVLNGMDFITLVGMPPAAWCAFYRREFMLQHKLTFMEGIIHEDQEFTPRAYYLAQRIMYIPLIVYDYVQRKGSIMIGGSKFEKKAKDLLTVADSLYEFTNSHVKEGCITYDIMMNKIAFAFGQSLKYFSGSSQISDYESKPYYPLDINKQQSYKDKLKYQLMNRSIKLYLFCYNLVNRLK